MPLQHLSGHVTWVVVHFWNEWSNFMFFSVCRVITLWKSQTIFCLLSKCWYGSFHFRNGLQLKSHALLTVANVLSIMFSPSPPNHSPWEEQHCFTCPDLEWLSPHADSLLQKYSASQAIQMGILISSVRRSIQCEYLYRTFVVVPHHVVTKKWKQFNLWLKINYDQPESIKFPKVYVMEAIQ